jgi:hypothetical protein
VVKAIMTERLINLVSPLAHKATDMRIADTDGSRRDWSGAVSPLIGDSLLGCDIDSKDGSRFLAIEAGSTGVYPCYYQGEWPKGSWWAEAHGDLWPARPVLWKPMP